MGGGRAHNSPMEKRPFWSRVRRLPSFLVRAVKEVHAVAIAIIGGVLFLVATTLGPRFLATFSPRLTMPSLNWLEILCGVVIVVLSLLFFGGYLTWEEEEYRHTELQSRTESKLTIDFRYVEEGFLQPALSGVGPSVHIRVLPVTPFRVERCVGYLEGVYRFVNNTWQSMGYTDRRPLHWSTIHEQRQDRQAEQPVSIVRDSPQFLDVVDIFQTDNVFRPAVDVVPNAAAAIFVQYPNDLFKFVIRVIGESPSSAVIALQIRRTQQWNQPEVTPISVK